MNKFIRYLVYAIGEIVLVVIGILIALQVNNWNQGRLNRIEEKAYYENIKRQLEEDKKGIIITKGFNNTYRSQFQYAIKIIEENDRKVSDSLASISLNLMKTSDFHRQSNPYQSLVNSGEIKLLNNQNIIDQLQRLEETYIYMNKLEDTHSQAVMTFIIPNIVSAINVHNMEIEDSDLLFTSAFQNQFTLFLGLMDEKNIIYNKSLDELETLSTLLTEEILFDKS